ncbi:hypothetical protein [Cytobacillus sp. FSL H8-0458]|uniref:hypothetical protein n=1 Tax=Cytobacillus sp. FSL H8-0458 TaxID=2975346 RepID=UPI0030FC43A5
MIGEDTLQGTCELPFENYSNEEVSFTIGLYDRYLFEEDVKMLSLMNSGKPSNVKLLPNEAKVVRIEKERSMCQKSKITLKMERPLM